ncbi:MAG: hypothetical protein GY737_13185 [Desulfobacteraceae bacterium]|nr:hypothetical protein [Desulfobacteraceae bacterium]
MYIGGAERCGDGPRKKADTNGLNSLEALGNRDIELWVHPGNVNAIAFCRRLGFATGPMMKRVTGKPLQGDHRRHRIPCLQPEKFPSFPHYL